MSLHKLAVFPDTNLFLHYRLFNEIEWRSLFEAAAVEIQIAPVVTRELEERKTLHQSRKIRERAATVLKLLHKYLTQSDVREGVTLEFLTAEPTAENAAARGLNLQLGDDRLIGTVMSYSEINPSVRCVLFTADLPLTVKAKHFKIQTASPPESLLLPTEPDPVEKKVKQLETELLRYKSREPVLNLIFENGERYKRFQIPKLSDTSHRLEPEIQSKLDAVKKEYPLIDLTPKRDAEPYTVKNSQFADMVDQIKQAAEGFRALGRTAQEEYNSRVNAYCRVYENYLRDAFAFNSLTQRTVILNLVLTNAGTCPAEDIHLLLHFPDGFTLYDEDHAPDQPIEPEAPSKELNVFPNLGGFALRDYSSFANFSDSRTYLQNVPDPTLPTIRKTNSYDVTFRRDKLNHGFVWELTPLYVAFDSWESTKSFSITYTIHAANMIEESRGELGVVIQSW